LLLKLAAKEEISVPGEVAINVHTVFEVRGNLAPRFRDGTIINNLKRGSALAPQDWKTHPQISLRRRKSHLFVNRQSSIVNLTYVSTGAGVSLGTL
jgi:hypothetical protein